MATNLLRRKHALPIMLLVYDSGIASTSDLIRRVRGHPAAVISTIRILESLGVLSRVRTREGRRPVETRLTVRGIELVETPLYRWRRLFGKWNAVSD